MVSELSLKKEDVVLEIGAGKGTITKKLSAAAGRVIAVEIDAGLKKYLNDFDQNVKFIYGDALKVLKTEKFNKFAGNLPSSIIEPLLKLLTEIEFETAVFLPFL